MISTSKFDTCVCFICDFYFCLWFSLEMSSWAFLAVKGLALHSDISWTLFGCQANTFIPVLKLSSLCFFELSVAFAEMNFPSYNWEPSVLIGKRTRFPSFSLIYKMNGGYWLSSIISLLFWSPWLLKTNPFSGAIKTHSYFLGMAMKTCVGSSSQSLMLYESVCGGLANVCSVHYVSFNGSQFC